MGGELKYETYELERFRGGTVITLVTMPEGLEAGV